MNKEKEFFERIKKYVIAEGQKDFGFVGVVEDSDLIMLNTGKDKDVVIEMKIK